MDRVCIELLCTSQCSVSSEFLADCSRAPDECQERGLFFWLVLIISMCSSDRGQRVWAVWQLWRVLMSDVSIRRRVEQCIIHWRETPALQIWHFNCNEIWSTSNMREAVPTDAAGENSTFYSWSRDDPLSVSQFPLPHNWKLVMPRPLPRRKDFPFKQFSVIPTQPSMKSWDNTFPIIHDHKRFKLNYT